jgi:hypothetical protein
MTAVPWGSIEGHTVEDFVAALILLRFPEGSRITPSQGDQGVDVKVPTDGGYDVYQVKKYASALKSDQAAKVKASWQRVNQEFGAENVITGWYLVMPWDPTAEREQWFKELTAGANFPCNWKGLAHINGWAADNIRLVDYFFGEGYQRLERMIAALTLDPSNDNGSDDTRLDAVVNRYHELQNTLDSISPFYTYRLTLVRADELERLLSDVRPERVSRSSVTTYRRISADYYIEIEVTPISDDAASYDPISMRVKIPIDDTNAFELERFHQYGIAPSTPVVAEVIEASGPPGSIPQLSTSGSLHFANVVVPSAWESLALHCFPDDPDREDVMIIELGPLTTTEGQKGRAIRTEGAAIGIELRIEPTGGTMSLSTWAVPIGGKLPHRVLPELRFAERLWSGQHRVALSVPNGPALVKAEQPPARSDDAKEAEVWADIAIALSVLQRFTLQQLKMPHELGAKESHTIRSAAELVLKGTAERTWEDFRIVSPTMPLDGVAVIRAFQPLRISYDDQTFDLDATILQDCDAVEAVEVTSEYIVVRPKDGAKLRQTLVQRSDFDYRVLAKPVPASLEIGCNASPTIRGRDDLVRQSVRELRLLARQRGVTRYARLRKAELVDLLTSGTDSDVG